MDSRTLELRFLEQARRGRGAWRTRARIGIYAIAVGLLILVYSLTEMILAREASFAFMRGLQGMASVTMLATGIATWHYARMMEGAAIHVDPPPPA